MENERDEANRVLETERNRVIELEEHVKQLEMQEHNRCLIHFFVSLLVEIFYSCREKQYEDVCAERDEAKRLVELTNATVTTLEERVATLEKANEQLETQVQDQCVFHF